MSHGLARILPVGDARTAARRLTAGGLVALALVATNVALTVHYAQRNADHTRAVTRTADVLLNLAGVLSVAQDAETGQRGYVLTGDERYLEPYNAAVATARARADELVRLTADDAASGRHPEQAAAAAAATTLRTRLDAKLAELAETIRLRREAGFDAARAAVTTGAGKAEMDALRAAAGEMRGHEEALRARRVAERDAAGRRALVGGIIASVGAALAVAALVLLLPRYWAVVDESGRAVSEQAERLRTTLASIGDAVIATDTDGRITMMNTVAEQLTGWPIGEARGRELTDVFRIVNETTRQTVDNPCFRALRDGIIVGLANHTLLLAKDGKEYPIDDSAAPIRCAKGELVGCVLVFRDVTERREAERRVAEAEERSAFVRRSSGIGFWYCDLPFDVLEWDERVKAHFHLAPDARVTIQTFYDRIHPDDREPTRRAIERSIADRAAYDVHYRTVSEDGASVKWVRAIGRTFYADDGSPARFDGVTIDVTEQRLADDRLRESELRYRLVGQAANDAIWDWNLVTNQVTWNDRVQVLFGYSVDQIDPDASWWLEHIHPDDRERIAHEIHEAIDSGAETWHNEYRFRRADGTYVDVFDRGRIVREDVDGSGDGDGDGKFRRRRAVRMVGSMFDLTERKRAEATLLASERRYRTLFDAIDEGFCIIEFLDTPEHGPLSDYVHVEANPAYARHTGIPNVVGQRLRTMVPAEADDWIARYRPVLETGRPIRFEQTLVATNRRLDLAAFRVEPPELRQVAVLFTDVTERWHAEVALRRAKEEAEAANIAKDNFLATLSHELRTPLTPVLATLGGWEASTRVPAEMREDVVMLRRNVELEARLIDDLLDLTRVVNGKLVLNLEVFDLQELVVSVLLMYESEIAAKQLHLAVHADATRTQVRADPGRIQQAVWNLLKNAVKFTGRGGRIDVTTRNDADGNVQVIVKDTGLGISADTLKRLFTPFEQGNEEHVRRYGGLGLGLAITRTLIEAQGGSIAAYSDGHGRGARFVITLPTAAEAPGATDASAGAAGAASPAGGRQEDKCYRVMLVEDHADTARVLAVLLKQRGHAVSVANTIADAIPTLRGGGFDVLVSDIGLPDGTGIDLIREVREQLGLKLPAIALTGFGMEDDMARTREAGFDVHLTKPLNLSRLIDTIQRICTASGAAGTDRPT